jgi:multidrug resistance efflux pump
LDDRQSLAEIAVRRANLEIARAQAMKLEMMPREEELPPLRAKLEEAKASLADKQGMYDRVRKSPVAVSNEELNNRKAAVEVAQAYYDRATADLKLTEAGAWRYDKAITAASVVEAQSLLRQTEVESERLRVLAPRVRRPGADRSRNPIPAGDLVEFKVLQVNVRPGEYVGATPGAALVVLGTVGRLHVRVDIDANDIARFIPGTKGVASPRGNPLKRYPISFVRVEPVVLPKRALTGGNTERVDTRVLQVIYAIDDPAAALFVGQQLDVSLNAEGVAN